MDADAAVRTLEQLDQLLTPHDSNAINKRGHELIETALAALRTDAPAPGGCKCKEVVAAEARRFRQLAKHARTTAATGRYHLKAEALEYMTVPLPVSAPDSDAVAILRRLVDAGDNDSEIEHCYPRTLNNALDDGRAYLSKLDGNDQPGGRR
jgi:hypothetical protein